MLAAAGMALFSGKPKKKNPASAGFFKCLTLRLVPKAGLHLCMAISVSY
jgi:hypothetical protein